MLGKTADLNLSSKARPNSANGPYEEVFARTQRGGKDGGALLRSAHRKHNRCGRHLMLAAKSALHWGRGEYFPLPLSRGTLKDERKSLQRGILPCNDQTNIPTCSIHSRGKKTAK